MGSWDHTCMLTNLPITPGDSVYLFYLLERPDYAGNKGDRCCPNTWWHPLPLFMEAEYADYGDFEEISEDVRGDLFNAIKEKIIEQEGEKYRCPEVKKETLTWEAIEGADFERKLLVESHKFPEEKGEPPRHLTRVQIRKEVLDKLLDKYKIRYSGEDTGYHTKRISFKQSLERETEYIIGDYLKDAVERKTKWDKMLPIYQAEKEGKWEDWMGWEMVRPSYDRARELYCVFDDYFLKQHIVNPAQLLFDWHQAGKDVSLLVKNYLMYVWLNYFYSDCRKAFMPPTGEGSQNIRTDAQRLLANLTNTGAKKLKKEWDENE